MESGLRRKVGADERRRRVLGAVLRDVGDGGWHHPRPRLAGRSTDRADGYRHLSRLAVMALQSYLEFGDADFPAFHRYDDDAVQWGGPNVDNQYLRARIDGHGRRVPHHG